MVMQGFGDSEGRFEKTIGKTKDDGMKGHGDTMAEEITAGNVKRDFIKRAEALAGQTPTPYELRDTPYDPEVRLEAGGPKYKVSELRDIVKEHRGNIEKLVALDLRFKIRGNYVDHLIKQVDKMADKIQEQEDEFDAYVIANDKVVDRQIDKYNALLEKAHKLATYLATAQRMIGARTIKDIMEEENARTNP
jgi:hypothetical protein